MRYISGEMILMPSMNGGDKASKAKSHAGGTPTHPAAPLGPVIDSFFELHKAIGEHKTTEIPINLLMSLRKLANGISPQEILDDKNRKSDESEPDNTELIAHLQRVAAYAELLALKAGLKESEARLVKQISPMHDIGKLAIPEHILQKPSELTPAEWEIMKTHTEVGYALLKDCQLEVLQMGALVAKQHQEKFDGSGYPLGLKGDEIHLYSRITTVADVFDALGSKRSYKEAWPMEDIIAYFKAGRGTHFDPALVDLLLDHVDAFVAIRENSRI
jgi:HD-GYP domain-containing protein (c-di-GMP phosphodiesterase class II)